MYMIIGIKTLADEREILVIDTQYDERVVMEQLVDEPAFDVVTVFKFSGDIDVECVVNTNPDYTPVRGQRD